MKASQKYNLVKIEACAGAGKTSTLCMIAEKLVVRSLYWAFNKVTADEAQEKFPPHVTSCTTHSSAYAAFGRPMAHKLKRPVGRYVNVAGTGIEIDTKDFVKLLQSAVALYQRNLKEVKHDKITPYLTWYDLLEDCEEDRELKRVAGMVQSGSAYRVIELLLSYVRSNDPQITFTTAHKSKGREWEQVVLADDFPSHFNKDGEWIGLMEAEQNLLYVAATRAKRVLEINSPIIELKERYEERDLGEYDDEHSELGRGENHE